MMDIIIIGGGPAGLTAAVYAARARLSAAILEKDGAGAGQIAAAEQVDNYPGLPGISGWDLSEKLREHAAAFGAEFINSEAEKILRSENGFTVQLKNGGGLESRTVICAAGTSYRWLGVPGGELSGVSYCATCDGAFCSGKVVAVIGGGDTAFSDALYLSKIAARVLLIHRRDTFRAGAALVEQAKNTSNIEIITNAVLTKVVGESRVEALELTIENEERTIAADNVFAAIGSVPNSDILRGLAELDKYGYVIADESCRTSLNGIYAAGDVRAKALRQVITAASDGANAVHSITEDL